MNLEEADLYYRTLKMQNQHEKKHYNLYHNDNNEYIKKNEFMISNSCYKGIILFKNGNTYLLDIYISNGYDSIITGLLSLKISKFQDVEIKYQEYLDYVKNSDIMTILKNGQKKFHW